MFSSLVELAPYQVLGCTASTVSSVCLCNQYLYYVPEDIQTSPDVERPPGRLLGPCGIRLRAPVPYLGEVRGLSLQRIIKLQIRGAIYNTTYVCISLGETPH